MPASFESFRIRPSCETGSHEQEHAKVLKEFSLSPAKTRNSPSAFFGKVMKGRSGLSTTADSGVALVCCSKQRTRSFESISEKLQETVPFVTAL
ncbi:hypothetical protein TGME49_231865 [Toxoplasma gondii ME49]|uniref:Uncharacterized protein n=11 Tax=Toxoplasma gondii TaxID=5811 RepID=A0A125YIC1_TOXGV|nr:hypothetical protein TGME49_231865 [Toxoplasma gondii ME49]EPR64294.1 hypothetical protein TGGT1_231865 [Toxoplasma gondii GT1]ESS35702.1 hypothetical protein TGVEG_231865 [Toxoplasma gondii VEG]KAF4641782.1 hypothetical protein TGRH88_075930 [Toxoplasma gondii]KFG48567.1 hypothetical protein TGDOM2_231865 [Toxoplasma gondii GAB2-2007-GAL-DOM2]KFG51069.1 hypothetical protein TGP89_231865 [Toxoplasma gondii p89]KFG55371.1 hypothetical protein TGFOU_231865 [Toxoplasma gondii FOU]KYF46133.1 |eukprot:XP_018636837.1 hypothetical protein TGME49_231865 [Toxoplasma gondii ME49]